MRGKTCDILPFLGKIKDIELARRFNVSRQRISQIRQQHKIGRMPSCSLHSESRIKNVIDGIANNKTKNEICKELGMSAETFDNLIHYYNITYKHVRRKKPILLKELTPEMFVERKNGGTMATLAKELNVSLQTLYRWKNKHIERKPDESVKV